MHTPLGEHSDEILHHLHILNTQVRRQMSPWFVFRNGLIYGVGFIVGSTLLTALVVTITLTFFGNTLFADVILWIAHSTR